MAAAIGFVARTTFFGGDCPFYQIGSSQSNYHANYNYLPIHTSEGRDYSAFLLQV